MMDLYGNWTGISYYPSLRSFILENTMRLTIVMGGESGTLRATVNEICEMPGGGRKSLWETSRKQQNEFQLSGKYNQEENTLLFTGERRGDDQNMMMYCVLELKLIDAEEKLEGTFRDMDNPLDCQQVELHKGDERRDLLELQKMGERFLEKMKRMEAEGLLDFSDDDEDNLDWMDELEEDDEKESGKDTNTDL